jgi:hypothetical protein
MDRPQDDGIVVSYQQLEGAPFDLLKVVGEMPTSAKTLIKYGCQLNLDFLPRKISLAGRNGSQTCCTQKSSKVFLFGPFGQTIVPIYSQEMPRVKVFYRVYKAPSLVIAPREFVA